MLARTILQPSRSGCHCPTCILTCHSSTEVILGKTTLVKKNEVHMCVVVYQFSDFMLVVKICRAIRLKTMLENVAT